VNLEIATAALSMLERGEDFASVVVLGTSGSSPRHSGAAMLVTAGGTIVGTIGGGPLEGTAITDAVAAIEAKQSRVYEFESAQLGMMCGGAGVVLIEYVDSSEAAQADFIRGALTVLKSGRKGWLITVVPPAGEPAAVRKCVVDAEGVITGDQICSTDAVQTLTKRGGTYDRIFAETQGSTYIQAIGDQGTVYVFGAGHCGQKLVAVLSTVGFATVVVDDRADFANPARFPNADRIVVPESFTGVVDTLSIDENSYVVIVTRGHAHDRNVLAQALRTPARYIGMIGSRNKITQSYEMLRQEGFSDADLARVHAPIGLSIGAETPEEIAISIAGQLIQVRAGLEG
jgi:xanthine dehydrogenase accessory factor